MPSSEDSSAVLGSGHIVFDYARFRRLRKGWEFDAVFRTGRQQRGELVRLYYLHSGAGGARAGVTVGRKVACAARRSRGRRMLREAMRRLLPWVKEGVWIVGSLRERGLSVNAIAIYEELARLLRSARLLKEDWPGADWSIDSYRRRACRREAQ